MGQHCCGGNDGNSLVFSVSGMSCDHCVKSIQAAVATLDGVNDVKVDIEKKQVTVSTEGQVDKEHIKTAIEDAGYEVSL